MFKKYLEENLVKDFIQVNNFFITALILFIRKLTKELYFCINY